MNGQQKLTDVATLAAALGVTPLRVRQLVVAGVVPEPDYVTGYGAGVLRLWHPETLADFIANRNALKKERERGNTTGNSTSREVETMQPGP